MIKLWYGPSCGLLFEVQSNLPIMIYFGHNLIRITEAFTGKACYRDGYLLYNRSFPYIGA
jgi:hypothetical protein